MARDSYSSGPFCPVVFALVYREGLRTFAPRAPSCREDERGVLVRTIVAVADRAEWNRRFIDTEFLNKE